MNNAPKTQKTHREKQQPDSRYKMGLLEKKNNYKLRAQDHNKKRRSYSSLVKNFLLPHDQLQEGRLVAQEEYPGHRPDGGAGDLNANPG